MADIILKNQATIIGFYDDIETDVFTPIVQTNFIVGLTATKTADKENWASGYLLYTITVTNDAAFALTTPTLTDTLDPTLVHLVDNSVMIDGVATAYTYDSQSGLLTIVLPELGISKEVVVTFQVAKN